jgi:hypothetical protein
MKKLLLPLVAVAAAALPASALAWGGGHGHHGVGVGVGFGFMGGTKLSGTGTSFGVTSASLTGTNFTGTLATTWSSATSKTFMGTTLSCAPATASLTVGTAAAVSYTGKTCSLTRNGTTKYGFLGKASNGSGAVLGESGTTVEGAVFTRRFQPGTGMPFHANAGKFGHRNHH